nr:hypothetical protein [Fodinibius sp.]NIV13713.1 hypothetical protein [Fodinibius sp.]NIY27478.1 hypothetical protein [Fodinibius sp.]
MKRITNILKHFVLLNLLLLSLSSFLFANHLANHHNIKVEHLSPEDGVSFSLVYSIFQDSKGFMWFGTLFGLCRYDGNQFTTYRYDPG